MAESKVTPKTPRGKAMRKKHTKETMALQRKHLKEHQKFNRTGQDREYNTSHARVHRQEIKKRVTRLKRMG